MSELSEGKANTTIDSLVNKLDTLNERLSNQLEKTRDLRINVTGHFSELDQRGVSKEDSRNPYPANGSLSELESKLSAAHTILTQIEDHHQGLAGALYYIPKDTVSGKAPR